MKVKIRNKRNRMKYEEIELTENTREWTHLTMCNEQRNNHLQDRTQLQTQVFQNKGTHCIVN